MTTITRDQAQKIIDAADEVITALAGTNDDVHPDNSRKMCDLWDDLNDRYAPPEVVRELARIALASLEAEAVTNEIVIPEPATHRNINEICPPGVNQTLFASGWNASRKSGMNSGRIPPIVKGIDAECVGWNACRAAMLQGAEPASNCDELPLDYLQGHKDGLEWAAQLAKANHPETGDWLYDDPIELSKAIRKGPDMPLSDGNSPVTSDGNGSTTGKPLTITLPDTSSKAFWSGTGKTEIFHPETYKRWVKEAIERACVITGIRVVVK